MLATLKRHWKVGAGAAALLVLWFLKDKILAAKDAITGNGALIAADDLGDDLAGAEDSREEAIELGLDFLEDAADEFARTPGMEQYAEQYRTMAKQGAALFAGQSTPVAVMMATYSMVSPAPHTRAKVELWMAERGITSRAGGARASDSDLALARQRVSETSPSIWKRIPTAGKLAGGLVLVALLGLAAWRFMGRRSAAAEAA